ncbi:MAG: hypothetical protein ABIV43_03200 [Candidatus Saccharimonadales bacterium]
MKPLRKRLKQYSRPVVGLVAAIISLLGLFLWRLWSLTPGLSPTEYATAGATYGWHGLVQSPLFLPIDFLRSSLFSLAGHHGILLTRLPNVVFGIVTILLLGFIIRAWHGTRTAVWATLMFACNAWVLHISRLASNDSVYLLALPLLLVVQLYMLKKPTKPLVWYGSLTTCVLLLYVPGMIWLVLLSLYWQRRGLVAGWRARTARWQRGLYVLLALGVLPLLPYLTQLSHLKQWLGLPEQFSFSEIGRQTLFVPVHLLVRGPLDAERWLAHAPILDAIALALAVIGIWFYITHFSATRSRVLTSFTAVGVILIGLGGSVGLSLLVPMLFIGVAMGIAYMSREWLSVFPRNPVARRLGLAILSLAVAVSCAYNLRAYFVAWPHNPSTLATFQAQN